MRLPGKRLAHRILRQRRSRRCGGIPVLGYHRLGDDPDPFGLNVSPRHFEAHLDVLARRARPMSLSEAIRAVNAGIVPPRAVVVTFDDGYRDTLDSVLPLLERARVPATVFVSTGYLGKEFWWDELTRLVIGPRRLPDTPLEVRGRIYRRSHQAARQTRDDLAVRRAVIKAVADDLRSLPSQERDAAVNEVRRWAAWVDAPPARRGLTEQELRTLASHPSIEIGAHTVSHPVLSNLHPSEQHREIQESRDDLQRLIGRPVTSLSYPHGAYSAETLTTVQAIGFTTACCSTPDVLAHRTPRLAVPRLWVSDHDGSAFERWLGSWLRGFSTAN